MASAVDPGEQLRGYQNNHRSTTSVSRIGQGQAADVISSYSEPIAEPPAADGSFLIENPSCATEGPTEVQAGSALSRSSIIARAALSLLEANEAKSEDGTPRVEDATGNFASPHPSASEGPSHKLPHSLSSTLVQAHPKLREGENAPKRDSPEQAKGYSVFPSMGQLLVGQLLGEEEARSSFPQTALLQPGNANLVVCWWLQVFDSFHSLGNKIFR